MPTDLPAMMTGIEIAQPGGPEVLTPVTLPVPQPGAGELLIRVAAAGVNRPDVLQRKGVYPPPPGASPLPGLEVAGTVAALGPDSGGWAVGDPVCALLAGGGYAEYAAAPIPQCLPVPDSLSMAEAAGLPETVFTVWTNLFERAGLKAGEAVLIHGGSSGIGTTAIQMAKAFGARVLTTAGSEEKCAACRDLGADRAINYRTDDFVQICLDETDGRGVDVILDMVGGAYIERNIEALTVEGRHVSIAFLGGAKVTLNMQKMMVKRLTLTGSTLRPRSVEAKGAIAAALKREVWPLITDGRLRVVVHTTFPLDQAAAAHALMETSTHIGKIVLVV